MTNKLFFVLGAIVIILAIIPQPATSEMCFRPKKFDTSEMVKQYIECMRASNGRYGKRSYPGRLMAKSNSRIAKDFYQPNGNLPGWYEFLKYNSRDQLD